MGPSPLRTERLLVLLEVRKVPHQLVLKPLFALPAALGGRCKGREAGVAVATVAWEKHLWREDRTLDTALPVSHLSQVM